MKYEIVVLCHKCKKWGGMQTDDYLKARFKCKFCGKSRKLRTQGNWNVKFTVPRIEEALSDCVARLNKDGN